MSRTVTLLASTLLPALLAACITPQRAERALGHHQLGQVFFDDGDLPGSVSELQEAIRLDPYLPESHHLLANCYFAMGRYDDAEKEFKIALRLENPFPDALVNWGAMMIAQERWADAIEKFEAAADEPTYRETGRAYHNAGWAHYNLGQLEEARAAYDRVLSVTPMFCPSIHNLGLVSEAEGKLEEAEKLYLRANRCNSRDLNTWLALGKLYLRLDNMEQAEFHLNFVEVHDPDGDLGDEARQLLDELAHP